MIAADQISERALHAVRLALTAVLCAALLFCGYKSIHWQVVWDPSIMHYVNFLMDHGLAPYRDIVDINLPGSYFMDRFAMAIFGAGDLGWRIYEFCLLGIMAGAMVVISLPYDWFAGFCAASLFTLTHMLEGTRNAGQREELMTVLILVGYAALFTAMRRRRPLPMVLFGFMLGLAASLKPTAALLLVLLPAMAAFSLRRLGLRSRPYLLYTCVGFAAALVPNLWFFLHYHAFHDFVAVSGRLVAFYAGVGNDRLAVLIRGLLGIRMVGLLVVGAWLTYVNTRRTAWQSMERNMLLAGAAFGAISYLAQRKDFEHHLYTYFALVVLWAMIEAGRAWKTPGWRRTAGLLVFLFFMGYRGKHYVRLMASTNSMQAQEANLSEDLRRVAGRDALQHQVLCFDVVSSCYSTLYHDNILPYSNLVADYMVLPPRGSGPVAYYQDALWQQLQHSAPRVIVLTDMWLCSGFSYSKLNQWPAAARYLNANYQMVSSQKNTGLGGYRVYVRKPGIDPAHPLLPSA